MNVFPSLPGIAWPVTVSPLWNNDLQRTKTGRAVASTYQQYPLYKFAVKFNYLSQDDFDTLVGFFNGQSANLAPFWFDAGPGWDSVSGQVIGTADGSTAVFALLRSYGGYIEPIVAAFAGAGPTTDDTWSADSSMTVDTGAGPFAYVDGVEVAATFNSPSNGQVTLASAPASGTVSWTGNYYFQCRFSDGSYDIDQFVSQLYRTKQITLETYW